MTIKPCVKFSILLLFWAMLFSVKWIVVVAVCVLLHEAAHMAACRMLGIPVFGVKPLPWGLTAWAPLMYEPHAQLIVSAAGPMFNFFLLTFSSFVEKIFGKGIAELFVIANLADGFLNLIPALPLDGGIILKSFLCAKLGFVRGFVYMIRITVAVGIILMILGVQMFFITGYNMSYFVAGIFIIFNIRHEKELILCIKKRILTGEIRSVSVTKQMCVSHDSHALCLVDFISPSHTIVFKVMKDRKEIGTVNQNRLIDCVIKNTMITVGECIEKT